jgi:2-iminobutanoate/2-iminopropanoate deaminase
MKFMKLKHPSYETETRLPISNFRRAGDTIYVSGQGAVGPDGHYVCEDFEGQMHYTMERLKDALTEAGAALTDVVRVCGYVQNEADLSAYNRLYREYFSEPFPARTTIVNCLPTGLLFEIDAVAVSEKA